MKYYLVSLLSGVLGVFIHSYISDSNFQLELNGREFTTKELIESGCATYSKKGELETINFKGCEPLKEK